MPVKINGTKNVFVLSASVSACTCKHNANKINRVLIVPFSAYGYTSKLSFFLHYDYLSGIRSSEIGECEKVSSRKVRNLASGVNKNK